MMTFREGRRHPVAASPILTFRVWPRVEHEPMLLLGSHGVTRPAQIGPRRTLASAEHRCEAATVTTSASSAIRDAQAGASQASYRAAALRPRQLVGRDREIA